MAEAKIKKVRNSIQNKELTQEEALDYFSKMATYDEVITKRERGDVTTNGVILKKGIKHLQKDLKDPTIDTQKKQRMTGQLNELYNLNEKARRAKFNVWVQLIVRLRNQYTVGGGYTKRSFRQEVQTYLK